MSFHKRSTNERVLARHHLKRLPSAVDLLGVDPEAVVSDSADSVVTPSIPPNHPAATLSAASIPVVETSSTFTFPPVGSAKLPSATSTVLSPNPTPPRSSSPVSPTVTSTSSSISAQASSSSIPTSAFTGNRGSPSVTSAQADAASTSTGSTSSAASHGLSSGAVGGIVVLVVILAVAVAGFFVRRRFQQRRAIKRNTWGAGLVPALENRRDTVYAGQPSAGQFTTPGGGVGAHERLANVPRTFEMSQTLSVNVTAGLATPASSYNPGFPPPASPFVPSSIRAPSLKSVAPSTPGTGASSAFEVAIVARTFVPSLPDELHIGNGEQIHVLTAYDDGWALCSNFRGEQGVVPLECLEKLTNAPAEMQLQPQSEFGSESNRTSKRLSSLMPHAAGTY